MSLRMPPELRSQVEDWAEAQKLTLSKAICRLLEQALTVARIDAQVQANRAAAAPKRKKAKRMS